MLAAKVAVVAPAGTVTDAGTEMTGLPLERLTTIPPLAAAPLRVTVHGSETAPDTLLFAHESELNAAGAVPVPLRVTTEVLPVVALLAMTSWPDAAPAVVALNCTVSTADCCGFNVRGKLAPDTEKPVPEIVAELTVTAEFPVDDSVTDCVIGVFSATLPKFRLDALTLNWAMEAFNCSTNACDALPAFAVSVTA